MSLDFNELYSRLRDKYVDKYPHNPDGVLIVHLQRTKLPLAAGIVYLSIENGIEILEIDRLVEEGKSLEEASRLFTKDVELDPSLIRKFEGPPPPSKGYERVEVSGCDDFEGRRVSLYGRVVALYVGEPLQKEFMARDRLRFVLRDRSGSILVEVDAPIDITLMRGSVVTVKGTVKSLEGPRYVSASTVEKLQTVEDGYHDLSIIELADNGQLPETEGGHLVRSPFGKPAETVTVARRRRTDFIFYGVILCIFSIIPVLGLLFCLGGCVLCLIGLTTEQPEVKGFEKVASFFRLLIEHHPPWRRDRCLCLSLMGRHVYLCARCTGTALGFIAGSLIDLESPGLYFVVLLALPAIIDWGTQKLSLRESTNMIRVLTGFSLGLASHWSMSYDPGLRFLISSMFVSVAAIIMFRSVIDLPSLTIDTVIVGMGTASNNRAGSAR
jgi:uncharacterized membrane protein